MNAQVIALVNQKDGVEKSTSCVNLGIGLAQAGKKVLLVDCDPQASLSISLGHPQPDTLPVTLSDVMGKVLNDQPIAPGEGILHHSEGVDLMPSDIQLSGMEVSLVNAMSRETILRQYLDTVRKQYTHILLDCQPSLGMLTVNALAAANRLIVPVQAEYLPAKGLEQLLQTVGAFEGPADIVTPMEQEAERRQQEEQAKKEELAKLDRAGADLTPEEAERLAAYKQRKAEAVKRCREKQKTAQPPKPQQRTLKELAECSEAGLPLTPEEAERLETHRNRKKAALQDLKARAETDPIAAAELARQRVYQSEAVKKSRLKMYEDAATGDPKALARYERFLATRRENYHRKKQTEAAPAS